VSREREFASKERLDFSERFRRRDATNEPRESPSPSPRQIWLDVLEASDHPLTEHQEGCVHASS
jgi:hypothetical protein